MAAGQLNRAQATGLLDQGIWAATNFALVALASHTLPGGAFGAFSVPLAAMVLISGLGVAASAEVLAITRGVHLRTADPDRTRRGSRQTLGSATARALGLVLATALLAPVVTGVALVVIVGPSADSSAWWLVALSVLNVLAEGTRSILYSVRRLPDAIRVTLAWAGVQALALAGGWVWTGLSVTVVLLAWGMGALSAAALGWYAVGERPQWGWGEAAERARRRAFVAEYLLTAGPTQLLTILAAPLVGLAATANLRAVQSVFGPLNVALIGIRNAVAPIAAEQRQTSVLRRMGVRVAVLATGITLAVTVTLALWTGLGRLLMGTNWPAAAGVVWAFALGRVAHSVTFGALVVLRAADLPKVTSALRLSTGLLIVVPFVVAAPQGVQAALWWSGGGALAAATAWWLAAWRVGRGTPDVH